VGGGREKCWMTRRDNLRPVSFLTQAGWCSTSTVKKKVYLKQGALLLLSRPKTQERFGLSSSSALSLISLAITEQNNSK